MLLATLLLSAALAQPEPAARYLEVPLRGEVGKEITAPGVRDAIRQAKSRRAGAVVFIIDTPGGRVADAAAIAAVMDQEHAGLQYHAVVVQAISAAVWPLSRCDHIFFSPAAAAGAAVAYSESASTGQVEVDAKFNAAIAAEIAAMADSRGQPGCVYRAMMLADARLFRWTDHGAPKLASEPPTPAPPDLQELDSKSTVLAWTARQAADSGFGTLLPSASPSAIGPVLSIADWTSAGDPAAQVMARAAADIARKSAETAKARESIDSTRKEVLALAEQTAAQAKRARDADPATAITVYFRDSSGMLTSESQIKWRTQSDAAIREWNILQSALTDLQRAQTRASNAVEDYNKARARESQARLYSDKPQPLKLDPIDHGLDIPALRREAADTTARLAAQRVRSRL